MPVCKKCGKEFEGEGIYCNACRWEMRWDEEVLNSPELESRRKRSHNLVMLSLDSAKGEAKFLSSVKGNSYLTTLKNCTCKDYALGHGLRPCKHILRLAEVLGFFVNESFDESERDYTLANIPAERKVLPEVLRFASDDLIEKYINILRFIYRGRKKYIAKFNGLLEKKDDMTEKSKKLYRQKLNMWLGFRDTAREIKGYKYNDEADERLDYLVNMGAVELIHTSKIATVRIPEKVTLHNIEEILDVYGHFSTSFWSEVSTNPIKTLNEIVRNRRRSEKILRSYDAEATPDWAFHVPSYFNDPLDIKLVSRRKNSIEYEVWTQGVNFDFREGYMLYRNQEMHTKGEPAIQIISAKRAYGIKSEKLNRGLDTSPTSTDDDMVAMDGYYPGKVMYKDFESGTVKSKTQMDFVKMLIGDIVR